MESGRFEIFSEFQINNFLTDIQITLINGSVIQAHKVVLAASSEFFKVLLNSDMCKEASTGIINLPSVDYDVFNYIFDFIYLRNYEGELDKDLSFYVDVIESCDYLRMLDLIKILDFKMSEHFSFLELCKEFDRISSLPLNLTVLKLQNQLVDFINSGNYSELLTLSTSILFNFLETDSFTINENFLWDFLLFYFENKLNCLHNDLKQRLIDSIRPGLLDTDRLESFCQILTRCNYSWSNKTSAELKLILRNLPEPHIRDMHFFDFRCDSHELDLLTKLRSVPYLIISGLDTSGSSKSLLISKISLTNLHPETNLEIDIDPDNFRCHSFLNHFVFLSKSWDLNRNLGIIVNLANYKHSLIEPWQHQIDGLENFNKFSGFSVALVDADLYLFGGFYFTHSNQIVPSKNVVKFNFIDRKWKFNKNLQLKVACWSSSAMRDIRKNRVVYISGGRSPNKYLKSFYAVDLETDSVIDYPNMPFSMSDHKMEMIKEMIVIYGGSWDGRVRNEILLFDLTRSLWRVVTLTRIPHTVHVDYCCRMGDNDKSGQITFYDLRNDDVEGPVIYLHQVDIRDEVDLSGSKTQLVTDLSWNKPQNTNHRIHSITFAMSLKLSDTPMRINENACVNLTDSDTD